jgi:hypothetical protein
MLIGWIRSIHQWELRECYSRHRSEGTKQEQGEFERLVAEITATLCDLEAEVQRQAGDLVGCIAVRIRQINDRLKEGPMVPKRLRRTYPREIAKLCATSCCAMEPAVYDAIRDAIRGDRFVEALKRIVEIPAAFQCQDSNPQLARRGLRLLDHVFDIAVCMKSLRANTKQVASLMTRVQEVTTDIETSVTAPVRPLARRARVRCAFRLVDLWTGRANPWRPENGEEEWLKNSGKQFNLGQEILQEYPGLADRDDARYTCSLNTVGARAAYLQDHFSRAYQLLDTAQAAVWPRDRGDDRTSIAVCLMHRAECLMLHAEFQLRTHSGHEEGNSHVGIEPNVWGGARGKLEGARTELTQAHELLLQGRPNNWWWTWLYVLFARFHHEWFALCLDASGPKMWPCSGQQGPSLLPFSHPSKRYLKGILNAIRDGLETVRTDVQRRHELSILWWQAFICHIFREQGIARNFWENKKGFPCLWPENLDIAGLWEQWQDANKEAGLEDSLQEENAGHREDTLGTWGAYDWGDIETLCARRHKAYKHKGRSLRNILLTVEQELLRPMLGFKAQIVEEGLRRKRSREAERGAPLVNGPADQYPDVPEYRAYLKLVAEMPTEAEYRTAHNNLAILYVDVKQDDKAARSFQSALEVRKQLVELVPDSHEYKRQLAAIYNNLGAWQCEKKPEEAEKALLAAWPSMKRWQSSRQTTPNTRGA